MHSGCGRICLFFFHVLVCFNRPSKVMTSSMVEQSMLNFEVVAPKPLALLVSQDRRITVTPSMCYVAHWQSEKHLPCPKIWSMRTFPSFDKPNLEIDCPFTCETILSETPELTVLLRQYLDFCSCGDADNNGGELAIEKHCSRGCHDYSSQSICSCFTFSGDCPIGCSYGGSRTSTYPLRFFCYCQDPATTVPDGLDREKLLTILLPSILGVILFLLCCLHYCMYRRKRQKASRRGRDGVEEGRRQVPSQPRRHQLLINRHAVPLLTENSSSYPEGRSRLQDMSDPPSVASSTQPPSASIETDYRDGNPLVVIIPPLINDYDAGNFFLRPGQPAAVPSAPSDYDLESSHHQGPPASVPSAPPEYDALPVPSDPPDYESDVENSFDRRSLAGGLLRPSDLPPPSYNQAEGLLTPSDNRQLIPPRSQPPQHSRNEALPSNDESLPSYDQALSEGHDRQALPSYDQVLSSNYQALPSYDDEIDI